MKTGNLLVEAFFIPSVLAHHDGKNRLPLLAGDTLSRRPIGVPRRLLLAGLCEGESGAAGQADEYDE
jgi:hypothetical protein